MTPPENENTLPLRGRKRPTENDSLEDLLINRVGVMEQILTDIQRSIQSRRAVSREFLQALEDHYAYVKSKLFDLHAWPFPSTPAIDERRGALEKELDILTQEKRREWITCWQETVDLQKELRSWFREAADLRERARLLIPSLGRGVSLKKYFPSELLNIYRAH
jgi:hypothetical protein